ncbi:pyridoxamine 5'-phosphate oxidase family protein [Kitasatospora sp. NBC_01287]|uniref:helix-turn-helix domain-containing protein n=1 Tax=Kitasatospora sp. NBC_01287 TaxID=2903573 RepID=UPI0022534686|nr:pyridoxamine 5'-phosphate oxidase family protein [Kitasatospora sp. NBC_01287]MCX4744788.1 pyridoxamine 5'-phosphate oxidase family protein [Kitasatospora sp. NBC_01287]
MSENTTPSDGPGGSPTGSRSGFALRVGQRRRQLGLTHEQLATRADMAPRYLQLLEELGGDFDGVGLHRLAAALETTPRELLEGSGDGPPGQGDAAPGQALWKLDPEQCRDRLGTHGVGRLALSTSGGPTVVPVNYTVLGGTVVYRTAPGTVTAAEPGGEVAFEVDQIDEARSRGWSVVVVGTVEYVTEPEAVQRLMEESAAQPWAGGKRDLWVRIEPTRVTGRIIRPV